MATLDPHALPCLTPETPTSVQPGGFGVFGSLELAWGRVRRAFLRMVRPGYVRHMAALRQGDCPGCPHDVIDSRDLKYFRNVCGHWFRPEDDRFAWRDHLPLARYGWAELVGFGMLGVILAFCFSYAAASVHWAFWIPFGVTAVLWAFVVSFFRDPHRVIPTDPAALVSPADGTVTRVEETDEPDFPGGRALRVSIFLSVFNVHVNRVPRAGRVTAVRYFRGGFLDARHPECGIRNEQLWVDLEEGNGRPLRVKQVSGAIARRIVCRLKPGDRVEAGEKFGMIKFGSRTDVLLPVADAAEVLVKVGDTVKGGSTILMRLTR
jgi:phosphatidylserine decarboxylase